MFIQYGEVPVDEVSTPLSRKRRLNLYSADNSVGRTSGASAPESSRLRPLARSRQRPSHPADLAQSRLFEALLLDDIDELEDRAAIAERRWQQRREHKADEVEPLPPDLKQLRQLITEARQLLDALHERFPPD